MVIESLLKTKMLINLAFFFFNPKLITFINICIIIMTSYYEVSKTIRFHSQIVE